MSSLSLSFFWVAAVSVSGEGTAPPDLGNLEGRSTAFIRHVWTSIIMDDLMFILWWQNTDFFF